jgi:hypothetical protein
MARDWERSTPRHSDRSARCDLERLAFEPCRRWYAIHSIAKLNEDHGALVMAHETTRLDVHFMWNRCG